MGEYILDFNRQRSKRRSASKTPTRETRASSVLKLQGSGSGTSRNSVPSLNSAENTNDSVGVGKTTTGDPGTSGSRSRKHKLSYKEMIVRTLEQLDTEENEKGCSIQAIKSFMKTVYEVDTSQTASNKYFGKAIKSAIAEERIVRMTGQGLTGSFKLKTPTFVEKISNMNINKNSPPKAVPDLISTSSQSQKNRYKDSVITHTSCSSISSVGSVNTNNFEPMVAVPQLHNQHHRHSQNGQKRTNIIETVTIDSQSIPDDSLQLIQPPPSVPLDINGTGKFGLFETITISSDEDDINNSNSIMEMARESQVGMGIYKNAEQIVIDINSNGPYGQGSRIPDIPLLDNNGDGIMIEDDSEHLWKQLELNQTGIIGPAMNLGNNLQYGCDLNQNNVGFDSAYFTNTFRSADDPFRMMDLAGGIDGLTINSVRTMKDDQTM